MEDRVLVTDEHEIAAVHAGEIEGEIYDDGEAWADSASLAAWRAARSGPRDLTVDESQERS